MNGELKCVTLADLMDQPATTQDFAAASKDLHALYYGGALAGVIGFIPQGKDAYLWMVKTPVAMAHPTSFARYAMDLVKKYRRKYPVIYGHSDPGSRRWLRFLGAEINPISDTVVEFTIRG
jgi:hypothetical protein